jgi:AcrR family transcriptional regulator
MSAKGRKAEQYEHTRRRLLDVGRRLFAEHGFTGTGTEEVVRQAGVTRGALYYHFRDKRDLFRAVVEDLQQETLARTQQAAARPGDPWDGLRAGLHAFLDACMEPAVQRIVLIDAPSVLGWAAWRELDTRYGFGLLRDVLQALIAAGLLEPQPVEPLAHMLLGALSEAGLVIAGADDADAARRAVGDSLDRLLRGLRVHP